MRLVLENVTDEWQPIVLLAGAIEGTDVPTRSKVEATRRACKRLVEQERLQDDYVRRDGSPGLWSEVCAERGYTPDARPAHPVWQFAVRRAPEKEDD
jgi:hypothetical protein